MTTDNAAYLNELQGLIAENFNLEELRARSAGIGVDADKVAGESKPVLARELILALAQDGRLADFVALAHRHRLQIPHAENLTDKCWF